MIMRYLLEKEFRQFFRNAFLPKLVVMFPVMIMLVLPWVMTMEVSDVRITVVDRDRSTLSARLTDRIAASPHFLLERVTGTFDEALRDVEYGTADLVLEIPADFARQLATVGRTPVQLSVNSVNGMRGALGCSYLEQMLTDFSPGGAPGAVQPRVKVSIHNRFNAEMNHRIYMIPALMVILLIVLCGFLPALNIVGEKERGTIEQMNVTPVSRFLFILAKLTPYWVMGLLVLSICMLLARLVYGLAPAGSLWPVYGCAVLFILAISGFGLVVSNCSATMQQALLVMFFFVMIFQLMSGLLTPLRSMPDWAQWLTLPNPPRYFVHAMRTLYLKGGTLPELAGDFGALALIGAAFNLWAVLSYRKRQ
jgi:ABC-2 type transport system permease protein